jgi:hypothetical protein
LVCHGVIKSLICNSNGIWLTAKILPHLNKAFFTTRIRNNNNPAENNKIQLLKAIYSIDFIAWKFLHITEIT